MCPLSTYPIANFFSERMFLVCLQDGTPNFIDKMLKPIALYVNESADTSDFRQVDSDLTSLIAHYTYQDKYNLNLAYDRFWDKTSSIPRALPIIYFEVVNGRTHMRLTPLATQLVNNEITVQEFLMLWVLRFQGLEYCDFGILTRSNINVVQACKAGTLKKRIPTRIVKPALLALQVLKRVRDRGYASITDKQFRHARRLVNQETLADIDELVDVILAGESHDTSMENQIFKILYFLGLCQVSKHETNNERYTITQRGYELVQHIEAQLFVYNHRTSTTSEFIDYYGGVARPAEEEILRLVGIRR